MISVPPVPPCLAAAAGEAGEAGADALYAFACLRVVRSAVTVPSFLAVPSQQHLQQRKRACSHCSHVVVWSVATVPSVPSQQRVKEQSNRPVCTSHREGSSVLGAAPPLAPAAAAAAAALYFCSLLPFQ